MRVDGEEAGEATRVWSTSSTGGLRQSVVRRIRSRPALIPTPSSAFRRRPKPRRRSSTVTIERGVSSGQESRGRPNASGGRTLRLLINCASNGNTCRLSGARGGCSKESVHRRPRSRERESGAPSRRPVSREIDLFEVDAVQVVGALDQLEADWRGKAEGASERRRRNKVSSDLRTH